MEHLELVISLLLGLCVGSFLSVCVYRIPRANSFYPEYDEEDEDFDEESIPDPVGFNDPVRSVCPECNNQLLWWHNIPIVSWFLLRGKCHFCQTPISFRYPFIELFSTLLALLVYLQFGFSLTALVVFALTAALLVVVFVDLDYYIIPNVISYPGIAIGIGLSIANHHFHFLKVPLNQSIDELVWGLLLGGGFLWLVAQTYYLIRRREGLGLGDVKLLYMIGAFCGPKGAIITIILGSLLGTFIGITILILSRLKLNEYIAFGPYLVMGAYLYIFVGDEALTELFMVVQMLLMGV